MTFLPNGFLRTIWTSAALATVAFSPAMSQEASHKDGFYGGLVLGYSYNDFDTHAGAAPLRDSGSFHAGDVGVVGGYRHSLGNRFFVAGELEVLAAFGEETNLYGNNTDLEKHTSLALVVKPGYDFSERWSGFVTLGSQWTTYELTNASTGFSDKDTTSGFVYGIGTDYMLDEDMSLTLEYNRVHPGKLTYANAPAGITRVDPELDVVKMSLKYHF